MAGIAGVHLVGFARRGVPVISAVDSEAKASIARALYEKHAPQKRASVCVVDPARLEDLPQADLVLAYHPFPLTSDAEGYLRRAAKRAKKLFIVTVCNPMNWGVQTMRILGRLRGQGGFDPPRLWHTEALAPILWELGQVKDQVYFDCPWWPDLPGVSAGQSLLGRASELVRGSSAKGQAGTAKKYVYGPENWPYFGGAEWTRELMPALLRHPCFDGATPKLTRLVAHLRAFLVDVRPRTPQARRRLAQV
jgi:hypothetical protein